MDSTSSVVYTMKNMGINTIDPKMDLHVKGNVIVENNLAVGLDIQLDDELINECTAREFVNRVQNMRKVADFEVSDRIRIQVKGNQGLLKVVSEYSNYISGETLADQIQLTLLR